MNAELRDHNVIYDQAADRGKAAAEPIWLNVGYGRALIVSVYDAARVLAKTVPPDEITTEPAPGITLTLHRFNRDETLETPEEQSTLSVDNIDAVVRTMRRSMRR